jgi:hypothetical protein
LSIILRGDSPTLNKSKASKINPKRRMVCPLRSDEINKFISIVNYRRYTKGKKIPSTHDFPTLISTRIKKGEAIRLAQVFSN